MAILKILTTPNPILKKKSKKISRIDKKLERLAYDMAVTIENYQTDMETGVAMAAPQIGILKRMVVIREDDGNYVALINPEIIKLSGKVKEDLEGCLSVPGVYGKVERKDKVEVKGLSLDNEKFDIKATGLLSRILQHEIDHLDGILFPDRIKDLSKIYKSNSKGQLISQEGKVLYE